MRVFLEKPENPKKGWEELYERLCGQSLSVRETIFEAAWGWLSGYEFTMPSDRNNSGEYSESE